MRAFCGETLFPLRLLLNLILFTFVVVVSFQIEDNKDSAVSEFIVAEYASSGGVHDVSIKKAPKERLGNAMRKLKGQMMVSSIMNFNKTHDAQSHRSRQTASFLSSSPYLGAGDKKELEELLSDMGSWDFDVWDVVKTSKNQVMLVCGMELLKRWNLDADLKIKDTAICAFFSEIEKGYLNNPYHNNKHGADVMYTVSAFIEHSPRMSGTLQPQDIFAALIAAAAHDYKHDGFNNAFHMNTGSTVALTYNDISVLESMHAAELFLMCHRKKHANIFSVLDQVAFKEVRKIITTAILGTDMAKHFNHIADFTSRLSAEEAMIANHDGEHAMDDAEHVGLDKYIMIDMALHCADISNPVKTLSIYQKWVVVVMNEFYQQGDKERELGIPISPMFDRNNSSVSKTQYGFINFIIKPIFVAWGRFIPELGPEFTKNVEAGLNFDWDSYYKEEVKRREEEAAKKEVEEDEQGGGEEKEDDPLMTEATHAEV